VGGGRAQGVAYLFYAADGELPEATRARLSTLEAFDRLGSGLAISARDLDLRGAGDLIGDEQAGHMKLIGTALYQRLLSRAVRVASGEVDGPDWTPQLNIGLTGGLPESDVPDPTTRINLYMRLARITASDEVEEFAEELEDRFGPPSADVAALLDLARIYTACLAVGVARIDAGPKAIAFTPATGASKSNGWERNGLKESDGRLIWHGDISDNRARADKIQEILASVMTIYGCGT
jgi:transcription-repair coupling factor (superfamily II helicase)